MKYQVPVLLVGSYESTGILKERLRGVRWVQNQSSNYVHEGESPKPTALTPWAFFLALPPPAEEAAT